MEGGRLVSSGTYGCLFDPPLLCKDSHDKRVADMRRGKLLGKLTEKRDYIIEEAASEYVRTIPNFDRYFVPIELNTDCTPAPIDKQADSDVWKCYFLQREGYDMARTVFYRMKYGGVDAFHLICNPKQQKGCEQTKAFSGWSSYFEQMLEVGAVMALHGFVHYDIHNSNIVVDPKDGRARLIDFGQAFSVESISKETLNNRWKEISPDKAVGATEPPEIMMLTYLRKGFSIAEAFEQVIRYKAPLQRAEALLGLGRAAQGRDFVAFWRSSGIISRQNWIDLFKVYWPGFDAWAIGATLLHLYEYCMGMPAIANSDEFRVARPKMREVLRGLLRLNPKRRLDCVEALNAWNPENEIVVSERGQAWLEARETQRAGS